MKLSGSRKRLFTRQFWRNVENKHYFLFLLAVFFTFASIGFVADILNNLQYSYEQLTLTVFVIGFLSTGYAYAATRRLPLLGVFLLLQLVYVFLFQPTALAEISTEELDLKFTIVSVGILFSITAGYAFFVTFITKVGINHFLMKAEVELAKEIHEVLVPEIRLNYNSVEVYGKSIPAQDVGGDLIDASERDGSLICTISDVSGHGVSSGVYTGMFKSSLRTVLQTEFELSSILTKINSSMVPLMKKNMFITAAMIRISDSNSLEFSVAGHPPVLHFKKKENRIDELMIKQLPIGFKEEFEYKSNNVDYEKGDLFVLITDGVTETSNKKKNEFGTESVKRIIIENSGKSAEEISNLIFSKVQNFGDQKDDVTMLVIKCC